MKDLGPDYIQVLEIIGTDKFEDFVRQLEVEGVGVGLTTREPTIGVFVTPIKTREKYNFEIPVLSASFTQTMEGLSIFDPTTLQAIGELDEKGNYKEKKVDLVTATTEKKVSTKQIIIEDDDFPSIQELLGSLTNRIIKEGKFSCKFNDLMRITKGYVRDKAFNKAVNLDSLAVRRAIAKPDISNKIILLIARSLGEHTKVNTEVKMTNYPISLIELDGFYWKREYVISKRTVFNYTPAYNELEKEFARFLDKVEDINKFAALSETFTKFSITYLNKKGGRGLYYPDFIAEQDLGKGKTINWIIETKGYEDENVAYKDAEAHYWCELATGFTKQDWKFLKVPDAFFRSKNATFKSFEDLVEKLKEYRIKSNAKQGEIIT